MYALGMAHAAKKPVILLIEKDEIAPFDVSHIRYLSYDKYNLRALRNDLASRIMSTLSTPPPSISIVRSVRIGGVLKTEESRLRLALPALAVEALKALKLQQAHDRDAAGALWKEDDLVFSSNVGTQLDHRNVRRDFIKITQAAGIGGDWTPRELRHSFVSLLSDDGMSIERISHLVGHKTTAVTESVYRHPVSIQADHVEHFARLFPSREAS